MFQAGTRVDGGPAVSGDFGPDDATDVAVGSLVEPELTLFSPDGAGGLRSRSKVEFDFAGGFADVTAADVNLDGKLDTIGSLSAANRVVVALGDGQDGLVEGPGVIVEAPGALLVRDLTADGIPDLIVAGPHDISVLRGRGGGSFDPAPLNRVDTGTRAADLVLFDATGDGIDDLVVALPELNDVRIYRGVGGGVFVGGPVRSAAKPSSLVLADFNGDGRTDLGVGETGGVAVFLGTPSGLAAEAIRSAGGTTTSLRRADLNGDGYADLVGLSEEGQGQRAWMGQGDGTLATLGVTPYDGTGRDLVLADLNDNRLLDTVATGSSEFQLGDNTTPIQFLVGDVNRDGVVNAEDLPALFAEVYDGDGSDADSCGGGVVASNAGADVNGDGLISAADTVALIRLLAQ